MLFPKEIQKPVDKILNLLTKMKYFRHQVESDVDPLLQAIHSLKKLRQSRKYSPQTPGHLPGQHAGGKGTEDGRTPPGSYFTAEGPYCYLSIVEVCELLVESNSANRVHPICSSYRWVRHLIATIIVLGHRHWDDGILGGKMSGLAMSLAGSGDI